MTTLFITIMGIGDVFSGQLGINSYLQFIALALISDTISAMVGIAIYINFYL
jgi:hypothetical protein